MIAKLTDLKVIGISFTNEATPEFIAKIESYFSIFAQPGEVHAGGFALGYKCLKCGEYYTGLLGSAQWAMMWGECRCCKCGWPGRGHHVIKDADGSELLSVQNINLQYHPDALTEEKELRT